MQRLGRLVGAVLLTMVTGVSAGCGDAGTGGVGGGEPIEGSGGSIGDPACSARDGIDTTMLSPSLAPSADETTLCEARAAQDAECRPDCPAPDAEVCGLKWA